MANRIAKSVAVDLDFNQNRIENVVLHLVENGATPTNPTEGQLWYDLDTHVIYFYNGSEALPVGSGGGGGLVPATSETLGGVKIGANINVTSDGTISVPAIGDATDSQKGIIRIATDAEASAGLLTNIAITPAQLKSAIESGSIVLLNAAQTLTNKTINADNNVITNLETAEFKSGVIVTEIGDVGTDNSIPTEQAVREALNVLDQEKANRNELAPVATSNSYDDLDGKPEILQSDWSEDDQTKMSFIQHKPSIPQTTSSVESGSADALTSGGAYENLVTLVEGDQTSSNTINVTKAGVVIPIVINNVENASNATTALLANSAVSATKLGNETIGSESSPVYINGGTPTAISYTIEKSVPSDAEFTDTKYSVFSGATSSTPGTAGLVKAPVAGQENYFLKGNGDWTLISEVPPQAGSNGRYLTTNGTTASWVSLPTVATTGSYSDLLNKPKFNGIELSNTSKSFYGTSSTGAATVQKEVTISTITELTAGQIIVVQPSITSTVANSTLKLNSFSAYPMRYNGAGITTSTSSIVWGATFPSIWLFDGNYWVFLGHGLDSDSLYSLNATYDAGKYTAGLGTNPISRYSIIAQKSAGAWEKITATNASYSTATTKLVNPNGFILNQLRYYSSATDIAVPGAKLASDVCYEKAASVDLRYSTNCGNTTDWVAGDYIYLVGTLNSIDGLFYLDEGTWWTKNLPNANNGKLYIRLGIILEDGGYAISFFSDRPVFYHNGSRLCEYKVADNKQDLLVSGTNIKTVNNQSIVGSGNITIDSLPAQSGNTGKFLTTDGSAASWASLGIEEYTDTEVTTLWNTITPSI